MTWDLEKDVTYSDVGKAINWHPFEPEEHFDRRLGTCNWCGLAVEASPVRLFFPPIMGIYIPPDAREVHRRYRVEDERDEAIAHFEAMDKCVCFHEWGEKVNWIAQTPPSERQIHNWFPKRGFYGLPDSLSQPRTHWLFGQCRSCGRAVERQLPESWWNRPPWEPRPLPDWPEAPNSEKAEPLDGSPGEQASSDENAVRLFSYLFERPETFLEPQWLTEEGVALDHDDEAIARYERLKAEKGSCECVDDDEPVDES